MKKNNRLSIYTFLMVMVIIIYFDYFGLSLRPVLADGDKVVISLNYHETGPYAKKGLDQRRSADLAVGGINAAGCDQEGVLCASIKTILVREGREWGKELLKKEE